MAKEKTKGLSSFDELAQSEFAKDMGFNYESAKAKDELTEFTKSYKVYKDWEEFKNKTSDIKLTLSKLYRWKNVEQKLREFSDLTKLIHWMNEANDIRNEITEKDQEILFDLWNFDYEKATNLGDVYIWVRSKINDLKRELSRKKSECGIHAYSDALELYKSYLAQKSPYEDSFSSSYWSITSKDQYVKIQMSKKIIGYYEQSMDSSNVLTRLQKDIKKYEV